MKIINNQINSSTKLVLLDFDGTLFDTFHFRTIIRKNLANLAGVEIGRIDEIDNLYSQHGGHGIKFDPNLYCAFVGDVLKIAPYMLLQEFTYNKEPYVESLFPDVLTTLRSLQEKGIPLGIFSEGNINFQRLKIDYSGLSPFIHSKHIYLYENKLDNALTKYLTADAVIVDNKIDVVDELSNRGLEVIWINRLTNDVHPLSKTITSLVELDKLIRIDKLIYSR